MVQTLKLDSKVPYTVIVGLDTIQGLQAVRILTERGVPVIALASNLDYYPCKTRLCEKILKIPPDGVIQVLEELGPQLPQKAVLVPASDSNVTAVSKNRERIKDWYHILLPDADIVEMLMDKLQLYQYAQDNGLSIAKTRFLYNRDDAEGVVEDFDFPVVLKPPYRPPEWSRYTTKKAFKLNSAQEFLACFDEYKPFVDVLIVQDWIEGDDTTLYSCNCYFNAQSEPLVTFVARKLRQWPPRVGQSCLGEECRADPVLEETLKLFRSVNYYGLGYVEMKYDKSTDKYYLVEPNIGRPTGRSAIAEAGGVDLLYTMYCDAVGWTLPETRTQTYGNAKWIHLLRDIRSALYYYRQGELTLNEYLESIRGRKYFAIFSWRDPAPFFFAVWSTLSSAIS